MSDKAVLPISLPWVPDVKQKFEREAKVLSLPFTTCFLFFEKQLHEVWITAICRFIPRSFQDSFLCFLSFFSRAPQRPSSVLPCDARGSASPSSSATARGTVDTSNMTNNDIVPLLSISRFLDYKNIIISSVMYISIIYKYTYIYTYVRIGIHNMFRNIFQPHNSLPQGSPTPSSWKGMDLSLTCCWGNL